MAPADFNHVLKLGNNRSSARMVGTTDVGLRLAKKYLLYEWGTHTLYAMKSGGLHYLPAWTIGHFTVRFCRRRALKRLLGGLDERVIIRVDDDDVFKMRGANARSKKAHHAAHRKNEHWLQK